MLIFKETSSKYLDNESLADLISNVLEIKDSKSITHINEVFETYRLSKITFEDTRSLLIEKIEESQVVKIMNVIALCQRLTEVKNDEQISSPEAAYRLFSHMSQFPTEHLEAIFLDPRNIMIDRVTIAIGGHNAIYVSPADIIVPLFKSGGRKVIVAHCHPSGFADPSEEDLVMTKKLAKACSIVGVSLLDHIIIGRGGAYVSLKQFGAI